MTNPSVAEYLVSRLAALGIDKAFGVPGDYAFPINDAFENSADIDWVGCTNELNAAYAADGYAKVKGAAIVCTTYGVGEIGALSGLMGSRAQRVPVFIISGSPSRRLKHQRIVTKHTFGDGAYGNFEPVIEAACCAKAVLTPENAIDELERIIRVALAASQPAYITVAHDAQRMPVIGDPVVGTPLNQIKRQHSVAGELDAVVAATVNRLEASKNPVLLPSELPARYGLTGKVIELIHAAQIPYAVTPLAKGTLSEHDPLYLGTYSGVTSSPAAVKGRVEGADLVIDLGGFVRSDLNSGFWTADLDPTKLITVHDNWVQIGSSVFVDVAIEDVIDGLIAKTPKFSVSAGIELPPSAITGSGSDPISTETFYPRIERFLKSGDNVVFDDFNDVNLRLAEGAASQGMWLWSPIGYGTAATLGVAMAAPESRVICLAGDGAHQMTFGEVASMGHHNVKPIFFIRNNGVYGIEIELNRPGCSYNELPKIQYHKVPEAFGCVDWLSRRVTTIQELEDVLTELETHDGGAYIEVVVPSSGNVPFPPDVLEKMYLLDTPQI